MESSLSIELQIALKRIAIIGHDFAVPLFAAIVPYGKRNHGWSLHVNEMLQQLENHGFIKCVVEWPEKMYEIRNPATTTALYASVPLQYVIFIVSISSTSYFELTISGVICSFVNNAVLASIDSECCEVHHDIAEFLEVYYSSNLRPHIPRYVLRVQPNKCTVLLLVVVHPQW
jgi:hypothetical protein